MRVDGQTAYKNSGSAIIAEAGRPAYWSLHRGFVLAAWHRGFRRREADPGVRAVAERLVRGTAAAAQRERALRNLVFGAVPVHQLHIVALDLVGPVQSNRNRRHRPLCPLSAVVSFALAC